MLPVRDSLQLQGHTQTEGEGSGKEITQTETKSKLGSLCQQTISLIL